MEMQLIDVKNDDITSLILDNLSIIPDFSNKIYGDGTTSNKIINALVNYT